MNKEFVQIVGALIVLIGSVMAARYTARAAVKASKETADVAAAAVEVDREDRLIKNLEARLAASEEDAMRRINLIAREAKEARAESNACRRANDAARDRIRHLEDRVAELERDHRRKDSLIDTLVKYVSTLRKFIHRLGSHPPEPPDGITIDD